MSLERSSSSVEQTPDLKKPSEPSSPTLLPPVGNYTLEECSSSMETGKIMSWSSLGKNPQWKYKNTSSVKIKESKNGREIDIHLEPDLKAEGNPTLGLNKNGLFRTQVKEQKSDKQKKELIITDVEIIDANIQMPIFGDLHLENIKFPPGQTIPLSLIPGDEGTIKMATTIDPSNIEAEGKVAASAISLFKKIFSPLKFNGILRPEKAPEVPSAAKPLSPS